MEIDLGYLLDKLSSIEVKNDVVRSNCPYSWKSRTITFRCADCEADDKCIICADCFFNGDHVGHRVKLCYSTGGACDCGDPQSWKPSGFCKNHNGVKNNVIRPLGAEDTPDLQIAVESMHWLHEVINYEGSETDIKLLLTILSGLIATSNRFQTILSFVLSAEKSLLPEDTIDSVEPNFFEKFIEELNQYDVDEVDEDELLRQPNVETKSAIFETFFATSIQLIPLLKVPLAMAIVNQYANTVRNRDLSPLSVQLFTIPDVAEHLVEKTPILTTLFVNLLSNLTMQQANRRRHLADDALISVDAVFFRICHDIEYFLIHPKVVEKLLSTETAIVKLVECLKVLHMRNVQKRQTGDHVEFESRAWIKAFKTEEILFDALKPLCEYINRANPDTKLLRRLLGERLLSLPYPLNDPLSGCFHIPITRLLTRIGGPYMTDVSERMQKEAAAVLRFAWEIGEGLWVRNGEAMLLQRKFYTQGLIHTRNEGHFYTTDIATVQLRSAAHGFNPLEHLPPPLYWELAARILSESIWSLCNKPTDENRQAVLARMVVQKLAAQRVNFATLLAGTPKSLRSPSTEAELEALVDRFATPDANNILSLNAEGWKYFDPFCRFFYTHNADLVTALESASGHLNLLKFDSLPMDDAITKKVIDAFISKDTRRYWMDKCLRIFGAESRHLECFIYALKVFKCTVTEAFADSSRSASSIYPELPVVYRKFGGGDQPSDDAPQDKSEAKARQARIMQALQAKSKAFLTSHHELSDEVDDKEVCAVCQDSSATNQGNPLVVVAALASGNGLFLANTVHGNPGKIGYLSSCGHVFHISCWKKEVAAWTRRVAEANDWRREGLVAVEGQAQCPICRTLGRFPIPIDISAGYSLLGIYASSCRTSLADPPYLRFEFDYLRKQLPSNSWVPEIASAVYADILSSIAVAPVKCMQLTVQGLKQSMPLFVRLLRLLKSSASLNISAVKSVDDIAAFDPKFLLVAFASVDTKWLTMLGVLSVEKNPVAQALERMVKYMQFACWVAFALQPEKYTEAQVNQVAYLADYTTKSYIILSNILGLDFANEVHVFNVRKGLVLEGVMSNIFPHMPDTILELVKQTLDKRCSNCKSVPEEAAVCMTCMKVFCVAKMNCGRGRGQAGICTKHAEACGGGQALFMLPFSSQLLAVSVPYIAFMDGLYVDKRGECSDVRKTVWLKLNERRLDELRRSFLRGTIINEIFSVNDKKVYEFVMPNQL